MLKASETLLIRTIVTLYYNDGLRDRHRAVLEVPVHQSRELNGI